MPPLAQASLALPEAARIATGMHSLPASEMASTDIFSAAMVMVEGAPADAPRPRGVVVTYDAEANAYRIALAVP